MERALRLNFEPQGVNNDLRFDDEEKDLYFVLWEQFTLQATYLNH
jgi:hypothetical protein